ncbi:hypothetical protein AAHE18_20G036200 [Arachis hypogaea]
MKGGDGVIVVKSNCCCFWLIILGFRLLSLLLLLLFFLWLWFFYSSACFHFIVLSFQSHITRCFSIILFQISKFIHPIDDFLLFIYFSSIRITILCLFHSLTTTEF